MNIRVFGQEIDVHINGTPVVEYIQPKAPYRAANHAKELLGNGIVRHWEFWNRRYRDQEHHCQQTQRPKCRHRKTAGRRQWWTGRSNHPSASGRISPVLDYHVHLKGGLTKEQAAIQSRKLGINYAVAPNCGIGFPSAPRSRVLAYLDSMRTQPFILAMQAEGREWMNTFGDAYKVSTMSSPIVWPTPMTTATVLVPGLPKR